MKFFSMAILAGLLLGCAPKTVPLAEESMNECDRLVKMTERVYLDKSADEVLEAATRLFGLVDGGYTVTRTPEGLVAQRNWSPLAASAEAPAEGADTWRIMVRKVSVCTGGPRVGVIDAVEGDPVREARGATDDCGDAAPGIRLTAYHIPEIYAQGIVPSECFASPVFRPGVSKFTVAPAVYDLFFLRMDHLLGKNPQWTDCAGYSEHLRNNVHFRDQFSVINFRGGLEALCVSAKDRAP